MVYDSRQLQPGLPVRDAPGLVDPAGFRTAMRALAASVSVVTAVHGGRLRGMTATAVTSVSADPPMVLVVVNRSAQTHALIAGSGGFVVNILAEDQQELADMFGSNAPRQFDGVAHRPAAAGAVLHGAAAQLECWVASETEAGTHTVFIGRVHRAEASGRPPLLYHGGRYATLC